MIEFCNFYPLGSDRRFIANSDTFLLLEERVGACQVFIFVWRDFSRVFIAGGQLGYDWTAREADTIEIEALAERFKRPELHRALALRRKGSGAP